MLSCFVGASFVGFCSTPSRTSSATSLPVLISSWSDFSVIERRCPRSFVSWWSREKSSGGGIASFFGAGHGLRATLVVVPIPDMVRGGCVEVWLSVEVGVGE
jgi:hypothetical protein